MLLFLALVACGGTGGESPADLASTFDEALASMPAAFAVAPNVDDDDANGEPDFADERPTDDEAFALPVPAKLAEIMGSDHALRLRLGDGALRVWSGGVKSVPVEDDLYVPGGELSEGVPTLEADKPGLATTLTLAVVDRSLEVLAERTFEVYTSPLLLNHHLQPAEQVWSVSMSFFGASNDDMMAEYAGVLGDAFTEVKGSEYDYDVWIQDEIEFATYVGSDGSRVDVVIDSIRNRGLGGYTYYDDPRDEPTFEPFSATLVEERGMVALTWGSGFPTSQDSFGNLEASPPVSLTEGAYPNGMAYWGDNGGLRPADELTDHLRAQALQAPFTTDIDFLCVGHIDEYTSFVPDSTSPKGFKFIINDVPAAWALLESLPASTPIPKYRDHGYSTVGQILDDQALRDLNDDIQRDYLDPMLQHYKATLGLEDSDIIKLPGLFEEVSFCGATTAALIPGMANLIVVELEGDSVQVFTADPFLREDTGSEEGDPMIAAFEALMPPDLTVHYLDDWDVYHMGLGEVHCGTNVLRTPVGSWWTDGAWLLE